MSKEKIAFIPKQYFAVVAVLLAIMMSVLDGTIMNIALPTLAHDFDVTPANAIWIINAYQLVITMTLLSFASLGDIYGYRRIFLTGISIFVGASAACALSDSFWMLTVSRIIQGFGAACVMSVNTALIRLIYPPQILGRGMGVNAMVVAVSAAAGPSIAGSILTLGSWHWLFVINIPLGLAALVIGHQLLPHNPASDVKHKFDRISAIANALTFGLLIYTLEGFAHAENRKFIAIQLVLLIIIGTYFIRRQLKETTPILPVDLLKIPIFTLSIGTSITSFTAQMLAMVSLPFFYAEYIGIQRRRDRFVTYPLAIGYHLDRTTCRQTGRESTSRIARRYRHDYLRYRPIHTLFASHPSGRMEYHLANGTLWYGLRAVPDAQ